ncbi:MAG TPA: hypothetical protein VID26_07760 [Candidatus Limnocylindrales bacterium]|jgi:hypothetical protein
MHPIPRPRMAIFTGVLFAAVGIVYYLISHDIGGASMEMILGISMSLMAYVLMTGSPRG